ncbi:sensor histidine kinase, partial [Puia sp.]|uniref:sensor histidine kinase n=1 Tax=Puia sp. TaxID=2045100 RepID=UPI002F3FFA94
YVYFFQILSVAFVFLIIKVVKDQLQIRQRTLLLEREKAETELKLLKAQLNPHFLFNTLNNIYSLSLTEPARTPESIARLADILDHILYRSHDNFVPLSAEVTLVKNYIQLEKLRYDHRLTVTFDCKIDRDVPIAPLLLLSLVENAFKHGASNDAGAPFIAMSLRVADQTLVFEITNSTGNEIPPADPARPRTEGIGLSNLQRQLDHLYGKAHQFSAYRERDRFRVRLVIDIQQETNSHEKVAVSAGR